MSRNESYSVLTRVRAQYGNRLRDADYREMASCKTVPEAAAFLRERTAYGAYFAQEDSVPTRGWLEAQLRNALRKRSVALCKFGGTAGQPFLEYVRLRGSVNELIGFLRYLAAGQPERYWFSSEGMQDSSTFSLNGLRHVRTKDELTNCLRGTFFETLLVPMLRSGTEVDLPLAEAVLDRSVYEYAEKMIRTYDAKTVASLSGILLLKAELGDVELLYRAKKYYGMNPPLLRAMLSGYRLRLSGTELEEMISASDAETVLQIFRNSRYRKSLDGKNLRVAESWADLFLPDLLRKQIHFSAEPAVVLFAYLNWMELEIRNLIYVIEGVRYRLPPEEICRLLLLPDRERA